MGARDRSSTFCNSPKKGLLRRADCHPHPRGSSDAGRHRKQWSTRGHRKTPPEALGPPFAGVAGGDPKLRPRGPYTALPVVPAPEPGGAEWGPAAGTGRRFPRPAPPTEDVAGVVSGPVTDQRRPGVGVGSPPGATARRSRTRRWPPRPMRRGARAARRPRTPLPRPSTRPSWGPPAFPPRRTRRPRTASPATSNRPLAPRLRRDRSPPG